MLQNVGNKGHGMYYPISGTLNAKDPNLSLTAHVLEGLFQSLIETPFPIYYMYKVIVLDI